MSDRVVHVTALDPAVTEPADRGLTAAGGVPPLRRVHESLRGRYLWAVLLALVGMAGGAKLGYSATRPVYRATGLIHLQPTTPSEDFDGLIQLPNFEGYMAYQVDLLRGPRTASEAIQTDVWKATGEPNTHAAIGGFLERLKVDRRPRTQHIQVHFDDVRPRVAIAGVRAVIEAYEGVSRAINDTDRELQDARARKETLDDAIRKRSQKIVSLSQEYGSLATMELQQRTVHDSMRRTDEDLKRITRAIRAYVDSGVTELEPLPLTPGEIAGENTQMAGALRDLRELKTDEALQLRKLPETSDTIVALRKRIADLQAFIDELHAAYNARRVAKWKREMGIRRSQGDSLEDLTKTKEELEADYAKLRAESRQIGLVRSQVEELQEQQAEDQRLLANNERLRRRLERKLIGKGRITKADMGIEPTEPLRDRRMLYGIFGGLMAGAFGVLIVILIGARDRRLKSAAHVDQGAQGLASVKMLGLLPSLPDLTDDQGCQVAAHCAHQLRMLLQVGYARSPGSCICITGPGVGSGKTTVSAALGLSFASSGSRTLVVDADLTGRGLTRRVRQMLFGHLRAVALADDTRDEHVRDDPSGRLLKSLVPARADDDLPVSEQLVEILSRSIEKLGARAARESGVVDEIFALADLCAPGQSELKEQLSSLLSSEEDGDLVPLQVLELHTDHPTFNGVPIDRYLFRTGTDKMRFLPLRGLGRGGTVSSATLSKILGDVREHFDVVLVDTGPAGGAIETSLVASYSDAVVFVVSGEDHRPQAERALAHLQEVGATMAGVVFNRAGRKDVLRSNAGHSVSRASPSD